VAGGGGMRAWRAAPSAIMAQTGGDKWQRYQASKGMAAAAWRVSISGVSSIEDINGLRAV